MNIDQIHPELKPFDRGFRTPPMHNIFIVYLAKWLLKLLPVKGVGADVLIENVQINSDIALRIYRPVEQHAGAAMLWIHGGGLVIGRHQDDRICGDFAHNLNLIVVSVKYRLAPGHQYPCAIDDCAIAWDWMQREAASLGIDPQRIAISGQSAGGGLAANLAQRLLDVGGIQPAAQILFSPMLDDRTALRYELDALNHYMWNSRSNRQAWSWYLGVPAGSPDVPPYAAAARRAHLKNLPPTWITSGDIELFYDEDCEYAERLKNSGVQCHLHVTSKTPHCFDVVAPDTPLARDMYRSAYAFLREKLGLAPRDSAMAVSIETTKATQ